MTLTLEGDLKDTDGKTYKSLYDLLKHFKDSRIKVVYPIEYSMNFEEYENINILKIPYLNLHKVQVAKYIPQMPKKRKVIIVNKMEDWF